MNVIRLRDLLDEEVYGGSANGAWLMAQLVERTSTTSACNPVLLDFAGVEVVTTSFLRTSVMAFKSYSQEQGLALVVGNLKPQVEEELDYLLRQVGEAIASCRLSPKSNRTSKVQMLGIVEAKEADALKAVASHDESVSAKSVAVYHGDDVTGGKRFTRWNNSLAALVRKGLLLETTNGRTKLYRPILKGLEHGSWVS